MIQKTISNKVYYTPFYLHQLKNCLAVLFVLNCSLCLGQQSAPNILLIISDDLGVDITNGYHQPNLAPTTPTLDSLRSVGITFENVWSTPSCTPTRAAIMSGKYGVKTGILSPPGNLDTSHVSLFRALETHSSAQYSDALVGKWHISQPANALHPHEHGADYFMGVISSGVQDYYLWEKTQNGTTMTDSTYITSTLTDTAIAWIEQQNQPWMMWLAHVAPHSPIHLPPSHMYSLNATGTNFRKYITMIEALDFEIGRLIGQMPDSVRDNTIVMYVGDNGTPLNFLRDYPDENGKGTVYQGGIRVPMIIAGKDVTRQGEREAALVHVCDLHATILEVAGADLPGGVFNSLSFAHLLSGQAGPTREYNYSENDTSWTIRNPQFKLISHENGSQEFYDLLSDSLEFTDLMLTGLSIDQQLAKDDLEIEAEDIRASWSCRDHIQNGDETGIDCGGSECEPCMSSALENDLGSSTFHVFPNPASNHVILERRMVDQIEFRVECIDLMGKVLHQTSFPARQEQLFIDLADFNLSGEWLLVRLLALDSSTQWSSAYTYKIWVQ